MDHAVLSGVIGRQPIIIRSDADTVAYDLAQICSSFELECATVENWQFEADPVAEDEINVMIIKNLHKSIRDVQAQVIEIIRQKAKKPDELFLLIALLPLSAQGPPFLTPHLNDLMFFMYDHDPTLEDFTAGPISQKVIRDLQREIEEVNSTAAMKRYTHDIVTFLRLNRAVAGGVSAVSTRQLYLLSRVLARLNDLMYVTPSLVGMAARKVYLHRILITAPENERSMQWGSDLDAVTEALKGKTPAVVVEEVIATVECPV